MSAVPHDDAPVKKGDVLAGKYRVEQVLGVGGMGVVVAATQIELQRLVALKFVLPTKMNDGEAVERFLREARAAVRLKSEHVARVLDVGRLENGAPYMVMEFLEGSDLDNVLRKGPLAHEIACDYIVQACEALAEAHAIGLVHRDLKPHNLFLTKGVGGGALVKVLDFGISKMLDREQQVSRDLTRTTSVLGSPFYMSPEQMRSARRVDARSDIWSLGVILYELLCTHVPWEAESITELALKVTQEPPTPIEYHRVDVPEGIRRVIEKCLQKDATQRYANAGELATDLAPFASVRAGEIAERARRASESAITLPPDAPSGQSGPIRIPPPAPTPMPALAAPRSIGASTHATWGDSSPPKRDAGRSWIWGGVALVAAAGVGIAFMSTRGAPPTTSIGSATTTAATATQTSSEAPTSTSTPTANTNANSNATTTTTQTPTAPATGNATASKAGEPTSKKGTGKFMGKSVPPPASSASTSKGGAGSASAKSSPDDDIPTLR
jgi:serine/threonine-protein kinase